MTIDRTKLAALEGVEETELDAIAAELDAIAAAPVPAKDAPEPAKKKTGAELYAEMQARWDRAHSGGAFSGELELNTRLRQQARSRTIGL